MRIGNRARGHARAAASAILATLLVLALSLTFGTIEPSVATEGADAPGNGGEAVSTLEGGADLGTPASTLLSGAPRAFVSAQVPLQALHEEDGAAVVGSFTVDGLTYAVKAPMLALRAAAADVPGGGPDALREGLPQVELVGVAPQAAQGGGGASDGEALASGALAPFDLVLPEAVTYDGTEYALVSIAPLALSGAPVRSVRIPATVTDVDGAAAQGCLTLESIAVADGNPALSAFDDYLADASQTSILLVPEGRRGELRIPSTMEDVDPRMLSRCSGIDGLIVDAGSPGLASWNGSLYAKDLSKLLRAPTAAESVVLPPECVAVGPGAFAGCADLRSIEVQGDVRDIDPNAFGDVERAPANEGAVDNGARFQAGSPVALQEQVSGVPALDFSQVEISLPEGSNLEPWERLGLSVALAGGDAQQSGLVEVGGEGDTTLLAGGLGSAESMNVGRAGCYFRGNAVFQYSHYRAVPVSGVLPSGSQAYGLSYTHQNTVTWKGSGSESDWYEYYYPDNGWFMFYNNTVFVANPEQTLIWSLGMGGLKGGIRFASLNGTDITNGDWWSFGEDTQACLRMYNTASPVTVTFNANGGSVSPATKSVRLDSSTSAPVPTRSGYVFKGWYASASGGNATGSDALFGGGSSGGTTPTIHKNVTYYAQWRLASEATGAKVVVHGNSKFMVGGWRQASGTNTQYETYLYRPTYVRWVQNASKSYLEMWCGDDYWSFPIGFGDVCKGVKYATLNGTAMTANTWYSTSSGTREVWLYDQASPATVTFNANGGSVSPGTKPVTLGTTTAAPLPTRSGYTFKGWYASATGGNATGSDALFGNGTSGGTTPVIRKNVTYYAQWRPTSPASGTTVTVNGNSKMQVGGWRQASGTGEEAGSYTYRPTYVRWVQNASKSYLEMWCGDDYWSFPIGFGDVCKGVKYATLNGTAMTANQWYDTQSGADREIWLYDQASPATVTWNANGGSVSPATSSVTLGTTASAPLPARSGYAFKGWYAAATGGNPLFGSATSGGTTPAIRKNVTYYAQWEIVSEKNGAKVIVHGNSKFMVGGWRQASGTSTQYETYLYRPTWVRWIQNGTESYLQEWCGDDYWSFPIGFGDVRKGVKYATLDGAAMTPNQWYDTQSGADREIWLYDQASPATVTWNANGGSVSPATSSVTLGTTASAPLPARSGYAFKGWYAAATGGNPLFGSATSGGTTPAIRKNVTYYAQWDIVTYTITYDLGEGVSDPGNPTTYTCLTDSFTLNRPVWRNAEGQSLGDFTGWTGTGYPNYADRSLNVTIPKGSTGNRHYKANWLDFSEHKVAVHSDPSTPFRYSEWNEGPAGVGTASTGYYYHTPRIRWVKSDDQSYLEWWHNEHWSFYSGFGGLRTGIKYATVDGEPMVPNQWYDSAAADLDVWIYPQESPATLTWDAGAEDATVDPLTSTAELSKPFDAPLPVRSGFLFVGWYTAAGDDGAYMCGAPGTGGTIPAVRRDATYHARWAEHYYNLVFDGNVAADDLNQPEVPASFPATYDKEYELPQPSRHGYFFKGWDTNPAGMGGTRYQAGDKVKNLTNENGGTVTLYARWALCYDLALPIAEPEEVTFKIDVSTHGVEAVGETRDVEDGSLHGGAIASSMALPVAVSAIECSALDGTGAVIGADGSVVDLGESALAGLLDANGEGKGAQNAAKIGLQVKSAQGGQVRVPVAGRAESPEGFTVPAAHDGASPARLKLTYGLDISGLDDFSDIKPGVADAEGEAPVPVARLAFTVDLVGAVAAENDLFLLDESLGDDVSGQVVGQEEIVEAAQRIAETADEGEDAASGLLEQFQRYMDQETPVYARGVDGMVYQARIVGVNRDEHPDGTGKTGLTLRLVDYEGALPAAEAVAFRSEWICWE